MAVAGNVSRRRRAASPSSMVEFPIVDVASSERFLRAAPSSAGGNDDGASKLGASAPEEEAAAVAAMQRVLRRPMAERTARTARRESEAFLVAER